ncbi:hypothetical protein R6Q59_012887 [Mikania micrantha]
MRFRQLHAQVVHKAHFVATDGQATGLSWLHVVSITKPLSPPHHLCYVLSQATTITSSVFLHRCFVFLRQRPTHGRTPAHTSLSSRDNLLQSLFSCLEVEEASKISSNR